jgi:hypothetical protein
VDRDDIIKMAKQAGLLPIDIGPTIETWQMRRKEESLVRFAELVAAHEREECADICEEEAETLMKISLQVDRDKEAYVEQANICACLAEQIRVKGAQ